jgi:tetratricopeptide (TPR) repeat protein
MNTNKAGNSPKKIVNPKFYFIAALSSLGAMGLFWSLDDSLIYIFLGTTVYFFFLVYWNRERDSWQQEKTYKGGRANNFWKGIFNKKSHSPYRPEAQSRTQGDSKIIVGVVLFVFFSFFIIVIAVLVFSEDDVTDETPYYDVAENYRYGAQYDSAILFYRKALNVDENHADALVGYGNSMLGLNNYDSAKYYINKVLQQDPENEYAHYSKGLVHYYEKDFPTSLSESLAAIRINPQYYDAILLAGDNYYSQNKYDSAIQHYETAYKNGSRSAELCHIMAYIYDSHNKTDQAIRLYKETLEYDTSRKEVYFRLGEMLPGKEGEIYRNQAEQMNSTD